MFAESYNPYSFDNPQSPRSNEKQKKREKARRRHLIEAELRRQAEMEQMQRIEEKLQGGDLKLDQILCQLDDEQEEQEELRQRRLQLLSRRNNGDGTSTTLPFLPTLPNIDTRDELEDELLDYHHQDSATCPPRLVFLKSDGRPNTNSYHHATRRYTDPGVCTIHNHTKRQKQKQDGAAIDNQEMHPAEDYDYDMNHDSRASLVSIATATPHFIAAEDVVSDDEEECGEEEDLNLMWTNLGSAIVPTNHSFP